MRHTGGIFGLTRTATLPPEANGGKFIEHYHGIEDIPAEHRVFSYPKLSIREQMAAYKEIIDGSSLEGYRKLSHKEREER